MWRLMLVLLWALPCLCADLCSAPIRFSFTNATTGAARDTPAYLTCIGRDSAGRFCHLDGGGRFQPCTAADNTVMKNGRAWCVYALPVAGALTLDVDAGLRVDSGRIYLSVGEPTYLRVDPATGGLVEPDPDNPSDPNRPLIYDWIEFALDASGFHGNTTCVDQFGMPVTLAVVDQASRTLGPVGITEARADLFKVWRETMPEAYQGLLDPAGRRILAPAHAPAQAGFKDYFEAYLETQWRRYRREPLVLTPEEGTFTGLVREDGRLVFTRALDPANYVIAGRPSTTEVFQCSGVLARGNGLERVLGAQLAAMLNRHVDDPLSWRNAGDYYRLSPCNDYARFWHQHSLGGKAYGFPYDDVNDQSPSLSTNAPKEILVAFRWN